MENEKHVPDVDDYDGDSSLASLFLSFLCGALPGVTLAAASRRHWVMWETLQKVTRNCGEIWAVFGEDLPSFADFQKQRLFLLCGLGRAPPSPRPAALADSSVFHKNYTRSLQRESVSAQFFLSRISEKYFTSDWCSKWMMMDEYQAGAFWQN